MHEAAHKLFQSVATRRCSDVSPELHGRSCIKYVRQQRECAIHGKRLESLLRHHCVRAKNKEGPYLYTSVHNVSCSCEEGAPLGKHSLQTILGTCLATTVESSWKVCWNTILENILGNLLAYYLESSVGKSLESSVGSRTWGTLLESSLGQLSPPSENYIGECSWDLLSDSVLKDSWEIIMRY